ncbi:MAG: hypothetical protein PUG54_01495 [Firmicutes bacterium]|nr:hypothetical protein [Bacillota bacterium]
MTGKIVSTIIFLIMLLVFVAAFILSINMLWGDIKMLIHRKEYRPVNVRVVDTHYHEGTDYADMWFLVVKRTDVSDPPKSIVRHSEFLDEKKAKDLVGTTMTLYERPKVPNEFYYERDIRHTGKTVSEIFWFGLFTVGSLLLSALTAYFIVSAWWKT